MEADNLARISADLGTPSMVLEILRRVSNDTDLRGGTGSESGGTSSGSLGEEGVTSASSIEQVRRSNRGNEKVVARGRLKVRRPLEHRKQLLL